MNIIIQGLEQELQTLYGNTDKTWSQTIKNRIIFQINDQETSINQHLTEDDLKKLKESNTWGTQIVGLLPRCHRSNPHYRLFQFLFSQM